MVIGAQLAVLMSQMLALVPFQKSHQSKLFKITSYQTQHFFGMPDLDKKNDLLSVWLI